MGTYKTSWAKLKAQLVEWSLFISAGPDVFVNSWSGCLRSCNFDREDELSSSPERRTVTAVMKTLHLERVALGSGRWSQVCALRVGAGSWWNFSGTSSGSIIGVVRGVSVASSSSSG